MRSFGAALRYDDRPRGPAAVERSEFIRLTRVGSAAIKTIPPRIAKGIKFHISDWC
jgi:hypothetical protein